MTAPTPRRDDLTAAEREQVIDTGRHVYGTCAIDCEHHGLPEDAQLVLVASIKRAAYAEGAAHARAADRAAIEAAGEDAVMRVPNEWVRATVRHLRAALADLPAAPETPEVWTVAATGGGVDRVCDSEATARKVCDDILREWGGRTITHGWTDISANRDGTIWVRYYADQRWRGNRMTAESIEQRITATPLNTGGRWFTQPVEPVPDNDGGGDE